MMGCVLWYIISCCWYLATGDSAWYKRAYSFGLQLSDADWLYHSGHLWQEG